MHDLILFCHHKILQLPYLTCILFLPSSSTDNPTEIGPLTGNKFLVLESVNLWGRVAFKQIIFSIVREIIDITHHNYCQENGKIVCVERRKINFHDNCQNDRKRIVL